MINFSERYLAKRLVTEPFQDRNLLTDIWGDHWGVNNNLGKLRKVLMHRPGLEIHHLQKGDRAIEAGSVLTGEIRGTIPKSGSYDNISLELLQSQFDSVVQALTQEGVEVLYLDDETEGWPDRLYTRDLGMVIPGGVILSRFALYVRYGETRLAAQTFGRLGVPILGTIQGYGFAEGGSFAMLDESTALIGRSERVSEDGIKQLRSILSIQDINLIVIDLPASIIHLDEAFLLIDRHKALVNTALLPYWFLDELHKRDIELIHVHPEDPPLAINALVLSPGRLLFSSSSPRTIEVLTKERVEVVQVDVSEIFKLGGGIHCITLPLVRDSL